MTRTILFLAFDGVVDLDLVGPLQVFATAAAALATRGTPTIYNLPLASLSGGHVRTRSGLEISTVPLSTIDIRDVDTVIVPGGDAARDFAAHEQLIGWLAVHAPLIRRVCSVCVGAFLLGEAGLLVGRTVTTHWRASAALQARNPTAVVCSELIYCRDSPIWTSAGVSAGIDLALHLVEDDHGRKLAMDVAKTLVVFLRRPGGQRQFSAALALQSGPDPSFSDLLAWAADHLTENLSVDAMAQRIAMSPRTFARKFHAAVGTTPAAAIAALRLEAAKHMLEEDILPLKDVASASGFIDQQTLRRAFVRSLGITPTEYRERFI